MRFAYIDSNGNEVPIPSVDALALRIELGAITDETQLYDAAADEWGPAHSHEIYTSLQRSAGEEGGFVAPPPVAPPPTPAPEVAAPIEELAPEPAGATEPAPAAAESGNEADSVGSGGLDAAEAGSDAEDDVDGPGASSFGLTLAEAPEATVAEVGGEELALADDALDAPELAPAEPPVAEAADDDLGLGGLDLAPALDDEPLALAEEDSLEEGEASGFDFGEMEGGLEMEEPFGAEASDSEMDFGGGLDTGAPDLGPGGDFGAAAEPSPDFSGGMELETAMQFDAGGFDPGAGGALDLEAPMSDFTPEDPPSWMEGEGAADEDVLDFSSVSSTADDADDPGAGRERRTPKNRPSPPKHRKQRNLAAPLVGVVILLAAGVGGYAAWPVLSERLGGGGDADSSGVVLPSLSAELMPQMEDAARAALAATFTDVVGGWNDGSRVGAPGTDWPGGAYLAGASNYPQVEEFWSGMSALLGRARGISLADFNAAMSVEMSMQGISGSDADAIRERADSGFVAAAPARQELWDGFAAVVDASLALHQFVVANEAGLDFVPASTATTNPVLEIDAATPEISAALDDMLGAVVDALADLGYRDVVSSQGLRAHLMGRLQEVGVQ